MSTTESSGNGRLGELGDFLRSRRSRLKPSDVGLAAGARRRTSGLRREEVAQLSGLSHTYYTFLEQGRDIHPSAQVLDALARALRLSPAESDHLYALAQGVTPNRVASQEKLEPAILALVQRLDPHPSFVKGRRWDVLAANRGARALFVDWTTMPVDERNELWWMFTDPRPRQIYVDWEKDAAAMLARFRLAADRNLDDPDFSQLIERLHEHSSEVREWWGRHEVLAPSSGIKHLRHPALGEFTLQHVVLQVADDPDQKLVTFSPLDGNIDALASLAARMPEA